MTKVIILTLAYNNDRFFEQAINSVLSQTYSNFEYHIINNGSTDQTGQIIKSYSQRDARIVLHTREKNHTLTGEIIPIYTFLDRIKNEEDCYFTVIDSDDWWEPNYLERLVAFLETNHLDLAVTGTINYFEENHCSKVMRKLDVPVILTQNKFAHQYPFFWTFPSTVWGSIMKLTVCRKVCFCDVIKHVPHYGSDTAALLAYIMQCRRIGIDNSALYHYRIHQASDSARYNPQCFVSNIGLYELMHRFLKSNNALDLQKQNWLNRTYLSSITRTLCLAIQSDKPQKEKIEILSEIAAHPQTADSLQSDCKERTAFLDLLRQFATVAIQRGDEGDLGGLLPVLRLVCPQCGAHVSVELLKLCQKDAALQSLLLQDNLTSLALALGERIAQGRYVKQFDLPGILASLLPENPLSTIRDAKFYRTYPSLCAEVIKGNNINALDGMTEALMNRLVSYGVESYLQLYLTLAALEQQVPAFLFGKVQLAQFYFEQGNSAACKLVLDELEEMGMGEQEEVVSLKSLLEKE